MPVLEQHIAKRYKSKLAKMESDVRNLDRQMYWAQVNDIKRTQQGFRRHPSYIMVNPLWVTTPWQKQIQKLKSRYAKLQQNPGLYKHDESNAKVLRNTQERLQGMESRVAAWYQRRQQLSKKPYDLAWEQYHAQMRRGGIF